MKPVNASVDTDLMWIHKNADVNTYNWLSMEYVIKDLIGILGIVNVNVINHVMFENI